MFNNFERNFSEYDRSLAKEDDEISGELGVYLNGEKIVEVANRPGFVYVRLRNNLSEVIQAYNDRVTTTYNLPVLVVREGTRYRIKDRDTERYSNWGTDTSYIPVHANQHSFNPDGGGGYDPVWVYGRQMMPMAAFPSGTNGANNILIYPYQYKKTNGTILNIGLTGTQSMLPWKPTDDQAVMGIVYVDPDVGNPVFTFNTGTWFSASITGTEEVVQYLPSINNQSYLLIAGIRLVSGTSSITWNNIYDLRQWLTPPGTGTVAGGGGAADGYGVALLEDGGYVVSGTAIDFIGDGLTVDVSASGTRGRVYISGSSVGGGGEQPWISAYDDDVFVGSGTSFSFDNNINVGISGSVIHASIGSIITGTFISGSSGGNVPTWMENLASRTSPHSDDDEFNDDSIAGAWVETGTTGSSTISTQWTEQADLLCVQHSGTGVGEIAALLKPMTPVSAPVTIETAFRATTFDKAAGSDTIGLLFTDGTSPSSNLVSAFCYTSTVANTIEMRAGTIQNLNVALTTLASAPDRGFWPSLYTYLRLIWVSANTWQLQVSLDGIYWRALSSNQSRTFTPTHFGFFGSVWGASTSLYASFEYIRVTESDLHL